MEHMGDVLEHGREPRDPQRRWVSAVVVAVVAIALVYAGVRASGSGTPAAAPGASSPPTAASTSSPPGQASGSAQPAADATPWPSADGACGNTALLPQLSTRPLDERTGMTVLVGGAGLRLVDVDSGAVLPLTGRDSRRDRGLQVVDLTRSTKGTFALRQTCDVSESPTGTVIAVDPGAASTSRALPGRFDGLFSAPDATWAYIYPRDPVADVMQVRRVPGGALVDLPTGFGPIMATLHDYVGSLTQGDGQPRGGGLPLAAVARAGAGAGAVRPLGQGWLVGATDAFLLTSRDCEEAAPCELVRRVVDGGVRHYPLPANRFLMSGAVLSDDGRYASFLLSDTNPDKQYLVQHPGGPSRVAVLDLHSGDLAIVPGVELAPKSFAGLTFSRDGQWLAVALNEGRQARLLVWRPGLDRARESPARLPGRVLYSVPVLDVTPR